MEPLTHLMTGACLARAGFNRKAAYATAAMVIGAEAPDLDTLWSIDGPVAAFQHHRGWTHTFLGIPIEAALLVAAFWVFHRWRNRRNQPARTSPGPARHPRRAPVPVRWSLLFVFSIIALLSHLLLDWTNNYGIRPFFPFNAHWYAGSFVFIFEPVLFLILLVALVAPSLFGLINSEVGARKPAFRGQNWAIFGLLAMLSLWTWRFVEHTKAMQLAQSNLQLALSSSNSTAASTPPAGASRDADPTPAPVPNLAAATILRTTANPYPANPYRWHTVVETPAFYQIATVNTLTGAITTGAQAGVLYKPPTTLATLAAKRTWLGEIYLDWSQWPLVRETGTGDDGLTTVSFTDLRFLYDIPLLTSRKDPPLSGTVTLNADRHTVRMQMDGRIQH
ncbi:MAG: metal-dependent hydrolase [Acidobacteriota bacterium]|nr:metal-dependent hydrolase [Acidobacteriota bacterium]